MSNGKVGAAAGVLACLLITRAIISLGNIVIPFSIDIIDAAIVLSGATLFVLSAYKFILEKYPDTRDMLPVFSGIVWVIIVSSYTILRYQPNYQASLSVLVTGSFVGMGWWIQAITTAANARRSHTLNIIMASRTSSEYQQQTRASSKIYISSVIPPELAEWKFNKSKPEYKGIEVPDEIDEAISGTIYILNYFEFLAQGIRYRDLDDCLLRECFSSILAGIERRGFHIIIESQKTDPRTFEGLIQLCKAWNKESVVERYRSNPDNAALGPRYPDDNELKKIFSSQAKGKSEKETALPSAPSLATTDGHPVAPSPT